MEMQDFISRTAAGLRRMDAKPDILLIIADSFENWEYDLHALCGIPIVKTKVSANYGYADEEYPIIPCFFSLPESQISYQVALFQRGYLEYNRL